MKYLFNLLLFLYFYNICFSDIPFKTNDLFLPKLNQELQITSINGSVNILLITKLNVGDRFKIKFLDSTEVICLITETNVFDDKNYYFGCDLNNKDNKFGLFFDNSNKAEGAILFKNKNIIYKLVYNEKLNCYYFIPQF